MTEPMNDARFVELLTSSQVRLRAYALSLVRIAADADDILQNACMAIWEKRQEYDPEREFFPWACGVVFIEVLRYRRKVATDKLMFDEVLVTTLAADYLNQSADLDRRRELLHSCVAKLSAKDRQLLNERYAEGHRPQEIAERKGQPASTVYSALARIRESLHRCIDLGRLRDSHPSHG